MVHRGKLRSLRESDARPTAVKMRGAVIPRDHALEEATEGCIEARSGRRERVMLARQFHR